MVRHIVFRCAHCRSTTSLDAQWPQSGPARVVCASCNAAFELRADLDRGRNDRQYYDRIRSYAAESRIDLASAYSVFEGIMPPEKTRRLPAASPEIPRSPSSPLRSIALLSTLLVAVAVLGSQLRTSWIPGSSGAGPIGSVQSGARGTQARSEPGPIFYQLDAESRLIKVSGLDLRAVLSAFCSPEFHTRDLVPYALARADGQDPPTRIGIVRNRDGADELRSVAIRLDARSGRWTIGTGNGPVTTELLPGLPEEAELLF